MINTVAFAGLGSVGAIYAQLAVRCREVPCFSIVRDAASHRVEPVSVNGELLGIPLLTPEQVVRKADLILVAVKYHALEDALSQIAPAVREGTIILSLLNGISSEWIISRRFPQAQVLYAFGSGIDANRTGRAVQMNRRGTIVFGASGPEQAQAVEEVRAYFQKADIPFAVSGNIIRDLWWKLMVNVGMNQVSAVTGLTFGAFRENEEAMNLMRSAQREVIAVANAQGIPMNGEDIAQWEKQLAGLSPQGLSSTLQDIRAQRKTEVALYGEEICRQGKKWGIPTPVNEKLVSRIHEIEQSFS